MKKMLIMLMALMMIASSAFAEKITFIETATYHLGSGDSEITAHEGARKECIKKAAAAGGVYVETYSKEVMFELTAQETEMIAASVIKAVEIEGESGMSKDRMNYDITMECTLDTDDIWKALLMKKNNKENPQPNIEPQKKETSPAPSSSASSVKAHALVINCDDVSDSFKYLADDYLWVQSESGERVLYLENGKEKGAKYRLKNKIDAGDTGMKRMLKYIDQQFGDDYKIVYALDIKNPNEEDLPYMERKRPHPRHMIIVTDEEAEIIKQIMRNNHGGIPYDYIKITNSRYIK